MTVDAAIGYGATFWPVDVPPSPRSSANHRVEGCSAANASRTITIGTPMKAPGSPHKKVQKNTAANTTIGDMARTVPQTRGSM